MVKLTPELIDESRIFVNPVQDRELDLRNYKIPVIENLGSTYNQFDNIDFTDNDLRRIENFPLLPRLKCLFLSNNRINFVDPAVGESIRNVHTLILTNNAFAELGDLDALAAFPKLEYLSLMGNPVSKKAEYRLYLIHRLPKLRVLDFKRIRQAEKDAARALFKGKKGKALAADLGRRTRGNDAAPAAPANGHVAHARPEDLQKIRDAIAAAGSLEEVDRLNAMLKEGHIPGDAHTTQGTNGNGEEEMDT